jgi:hypothetical protein
MCFILSAIQASFTVEGSQGIGGAWREASGQTESVFTRHPPPVTRHPFNT